MIVEKDIGRGWKKAGEVVDYHSDINSYEIDLYDEEENAIYMRVSLENSQFTKLDESRNFFLEKSSKVTKICNQCGNDAFYDSNQNEYYCPVCEQ